MNEERPVAGGAPEVTTRQEVALSIPLATPNNQIAPTVGLTDFERVIERGMESFVKVGIALTAIRDRRLYRPQYPTFEAYCEQRWAFSRSRAYDLISSTETTRALSAIADIPLPANEGQARELTGLPTETAAEVMTQAAATGKVTAAVVRETRQRVAIGSRPNYGRRLTLAHSFRRAVVDLCEVLDRIDDLVADDRLPRNREQIARYYANDLIRARDALQQAIDRMSGEVV